MRYVAAYLLALLGGKASTAAADIETTLSSVGIESDAERLLGELNGKFIDDLIEQERSKLASVPTGGVGAAPAAEERKEENKEEENPDSEPEDEDMGFAPFDQT